MIIKEGTKQLVMSFDAKDKTRVVLRPARLEDAPYIINSIEEIVEQGNYLQKEKTRTLEEEYAFIEEMNNKHNMYMVVDIGGRIFGAARIMRGELQMKSHIGMFRIWLNTQAQGKGIGTRMMNYAMEWCEQHGLHKLCLTVFTSNKLAIKLYKKYGFVIEGVQKQQVRFNDGTFDDEMWMAHFFKIKQNGTVNAYKR